MPDMGKVIGHLNDCMEASRRDNTWVFVRKDIVEDTLVLLKEQEEKMEHLNNITLEYEKEVFRLQTLLKEQEPHVLSREEMIDAGKNHDAVYVEEGVGRCFWGLAVEGIDPPEDKPYNYPAVSNLTLLTQMMICGMEIST